MLHIRLIGLFRLSRGEGAPSEIALRDATMRSLLKYLLVQRGRVVPQEEFIETFWASSSPEAGRASLYAAISHLRRTLGAAHTHTGADGWIARRPPGYLFDEAAGDCLIDHAQYLQILQQARHQAACGDWAGVAERVGLAEALVTGELLACEPYADWAERARLAFRRLRCDLLELGVTAAAHLQRWEALAAAARQLISVDPLRESAYRHLMSAYLALQEPALALQVYEECQRLLGQELGLEPGAATQALYHRALAPAPASATAQVAAAAIETPAPPRRRAARQLPAQLTSFIGREQELGQVSRLVSSHRIVTLTGAGGCGKTRLALQVAEGLTDAFADGIWLIDLAPLSEGAQVPHAVARAMDLRSEPSGSMLTALADHLADQQRLLILDNCEHLLPACATLTTSLLRAAPALHILATSRERLGVDGEVVYQVLPLPVPALERVLSPSEMERYDGIRFFVERAALSRPDFSLTEANSAWVSRICYRLDGIPLALELAAARLRVLPVAEIAARLDDRFRLLTGGNRTALPRQQTLQALIDWSYDLLSEPERLLWRRLSVFADGFGLDAAEEVCGHTGLNRTAVFDLLMLLVDKSLVNAETWRDEARFRLLESMREYGAVRLRETGEALLIGRAHREWCRKVIGALRHQLTGEGRTDCQARLELERDNLLAALRWSREQNDVEAELQMVAGLANHWAYHPLWLPWDWLEGLLQCTESSVYPTLRARVLQGMGHLASIRGNHEVAVAHYEEALVVWRRERRPDTIASLLSSLGFVALLQANYARAAELLDEALSMGRTLAFGYPLIIRGMVWLAQGECDAAAALLEESLALHRQTGNQAATADILLHLGQVALYRSQDEQAAVYLEEALKRFRALGDKPKIAWTLVNLGRLARRQGDFAAAAVRYAESLPLYHELAGLGRLGLPECLEGVAGLAAADGDCRRAAILLGAAAGLRMASKMPLPPVMRPEYEAMLFATKSALTADELQQAWAQGQTMRLFQAIAYAISLPCIRLPSC